MSSSCNETQMMQTSQGAFENQKIDTSHVWCETQMKDTRHRQYEINGIHSSQLTDETQKVSTLNLDVNQSHIL